MKLVLPFLCNVVVNSFLSFLTAAILVELLVFLFRIKSWRMKGFFRCLPILKIPLDLFLYDFSRWVVVYGINPWEADMNTRTLSLGFEWTSSLWEMFPFPLKTILQLSMNSGHSFSLADIFLEPRYILVFLIPCVFIIGCRGWAILVRFKELRQLLRRATTLSRSINNIALYRELICLKAQIVITERANTLPFVTGWLRPTIVMSEAVNSRLNQDEYEAVIAHEVEHIRFGDAWMRSILHLISLLFWWVPTGVLRGRIEIAQEMASDNGCHRYNIDTIHLASAIHKCAQLKVIQQVAPGFYGKNRLKRRVEKMLEQKKTDQGSIEYIKVFVVTLLSLSIFFGKLWVF